MADEKPDDDEVARNQRELEEMNEITGAVKWPYEPFIHFPKGMWKIGAIWDQAYYEAAEYIVTGVCKGDLIHTSMVPPAYFFSVTMWNLR
jgi:hypothetical protein